MAHRGALDETIIRDIERWTQSSTFLDTFAEHALTLLRIVPPGTKSIFMNMRDQDNYTKKEPKPVPFSFPVFETQLGSFRS